MKNKRGQLMALYIPFLTLFMCALVAGMYWVQNSSLDNHMVSPVKVLELNDGKMIFEIAEKEWACSAYKKFGGDEQKVLEEFCRLFSESDKTGFIFDNIFDEDGTDRGSFFASKEQKENFCIKNYELNGDNLKVSLDSFKRMERLEAIEKDRINFVVDFEFVYVRKDLINLGDCD